MLILQSHSAIMYNWTNCKAFSKLILSFMFISLFTCSHISGECDCYSLKCICRNMKSIPQLNSNVTSVFFENSTLYLEKKFMFNLSTLALEELQFNETRIEDSEKAIFQDFPYLKKLAIINSDTHIYGFMYSRTTFNILNKAFNSLYLTKISKLEIIGFNIRYSLRSFLMTLNGTNITELSLVDCYINTFNGTLFASFLKHLQYLDLSQNPFQQVSWSHMNHLQVLKVMGYYGVNLPSFLASNGTRFFPNLRHLEIFVKQAVRINSKIFEGLKNLQYLFFQTRDGTTIPNGFLHSIPNLKSLHIKGYDDPFHYIEVESDVFATEKLQHLKFENIKIINPIFLHTPNLLSLNIKSSRIHFRSNRTVVLKSLKKLESFTMIDAKLEEVPQALCDLLNLKRIDLGQNHITFWNNTNCPVMSRLQFLSFRKNRIQLIEKKTFSPLLIANDRLIWDLSENPFFCICRLLWFMNWSLQRQKRIRYYPKDYICESPPELKGQVLNRSLFSDEQCSTKSSLLINVLIPLGSLLLIATVAATLLYYKRWSIRYFLYLIQSRRKQKKELEGVHNYLFDAFVCYHNTDTQWLLKELCPKLEEENNFSLCIHDRDFIPGQDIVENIVESIESSRKVLLLLSNEFACSEWCRFEVTMAHQRVIERADNFLIIVLLEDIDIKNQSRRLSVLLRQKTYLEWTDNKEGQALFWHRLISCLKGPNLQEN